MEVIFGACIIDDQQHEGKARIRGSFIMGNLTLMNKNVTSYGIQHVQVRVG